jgi:uridine kinase
MTIPTKTKLIAIVGGSGSGKNWLADRLRLSLGLQAARLSLDDFYKDRSHLPFSRRAKKNFDHPSAIDWPLVESVLRDCRSGRTPRLPRYSFATHTRLPHYETWIPGPVVLIDGLWLLNKRTVNALFDLRIYLECPTQLRLERRLARDVAERGRTPNSIREQFWKTVSPMHDRYVAPQAMRADLVLRQPSNEADLRGLVETIRQLAPEMESPACRLASEKAVLTSVVALVGSAPGPARVNLSRANLTNTP